MMKKLLITDIDGTITHMPHALDDQIIQALHSLHDQGWGLFFLTGRYFTYARPLFQNFSVPYLLGCQNGACVWSSSEDRFLYFESIPRSVIEKLETYIQNTPVVFSIESGASYNDEYYRMTSHCSADEMKTFLDPIYFKDTKGILIDTDSLQAQYPYPQFAAAKIFGPKEEVAKIYNELSKDEYMKDHINIVLMRWPYDFSYHILFITAKEVSKGFATQKVLDQLYKDQRPFIIASGDDKNDLPLIAEADFKIVMNTAPADMLDRADFLAPPAEELGILVAWEHGLRKYQEIINQ